MNLYKVSQTENRGYDTFDAFIVAAENEEMAKLTLPSDYLNWDDAFTSWASSPDNVEVELIGEAIPGTKYGIILASFNAG